MRDKGKVRQGTARQGVCQYKARQDIIPLSTIITIKRAELLPQGFSAPLRLQHQRDNTRNKQKGHKEPIFIPIQRWKENEN